MPFQNVNQPNLLQRRPKLPPLVTWTYAFPPVKQHFDRAVRRDTVTTVVHLSVVLPLGPRHVELNAEFILFYRYSLTNLMELAIRNRSQVILTLGSEQESIIKILCISKKAHETNTLYS